MNKLNRISTIFLLLVLAALPKQAGGSVDKIGHGCLEKHFTCINFNQSAHLFDRGFTGHEHLDQFKIINMNARLYDPVIARFFSPDPYVQAPDNTQSYNRYSYCLNNPMSFKDPSGEWIHLVIGAFIGGAINVAANINNINTTGKFFGYFGVGALAGALSAGVGAGVSSAIAGAGFGAGFVGSSTAGVATSSFLSGAAIGGSAGATSGFTTGFGNALIGGNNFSQALGQGGLYGAIGLGSGALFGGLWGGFDAVMEGRNFWNGSRKLMDYTWDIPMNYTPENGYCVQEFTETADIYYGKERGGNFYTRIGRNGVGWEHNEFLSQYSQETGYSIETLGSRSMIRKNIAQNLQMAAKNKTIVANVYNTDGQSHIAALRRFVYRSNGKLIFWDNNGIRHFLSISPYPKGNAWIFYLYGIR